MGQHCNTSKNDKSMGCGNCQSTSSTFSGSLVDGNTNSGCCYKKEVGGIRYVLVTEEDMSAFGCNANCAYAEESDPESIYCLLPGKLPVSCVNQEAPDRTEVSIEEEGKEL